MQDQRLVKFPEDRGLKREGVGQRSERNKGESISEIPELLGGNQGVGKKWSKLPRGGKKKGKNLVQ